MISFFKVKEKSMEPNFKEGDYLITFPYLFRKPRKNDVVVFKHNGILLLKRIVKTGKYYFVKGDNKKFSSYIGFIKRKNIIGRVIFHL